MRPRRLLCLFAALTLLLPGCASRGEPAPGSTAPSGGGTAQPLSPSGPAENPADGDGFQTSLEAWGLTGLIPAGLVMTDENRSAVVEYVQAFDEEERAYVLPLLQDIAAGETTPANPYCDYENGVYLDLCQFCLYDMNLDGMPEFLLKTGGCEADFRYTVYTLTDGGLVDCGGLGGSHAALYANGSGGLVRYAGHMGGYQITAAALEGTTLTTREIADGMLAPGEDYPALRAYGCEDYNRLLEFRDIPALFLAPKG